MAAVDTWDKGVGYDTQPQHPPDPQHTLYDYYEVEARHDMHGVTPNVTCQCCGVQQNWHEVALRAVCAVPLMAQARRLVAAPSARRCPFVPSWPPTVAADA
jgi:hypothetical protein